MFVRICTISLQVEELPVLCVSVDCITTVIFVHERLPIFPSHAASALFSYLPNGLIEN